MRLYRLLVLEYWSLDIFSPITLSLVSYTFPLLHTLVLAILLNQCKLIYLCFFLQKILLTVSSSYPLPFTFDSVVLYLFPIFIVPFYFSFSRVFMQCLCWHMIFNRGLLNYTEPLSSLCCMYIKALSADADMKRPLINANPPCYFPLGLPGMQVPCQVWRAPRNGLCVCGWGPFLTWAT